MLKIRIFNKKTSDKEINEFLEEHGSNLLSSGIHVQEERIVLIYEKADDGLPQSGQVQLVSDVLAKLQTDRLSLEVRKRYVMGRYILKRGGIEKQGKLEMEKMNIDKEVENVDAQIKYVRDILKEVKAGEFNV